MTSLNDVLLHPVRAAHDERHLVVYQAYSRAIGEAAAGAGTMGVPGYSLARMTWIKPSFLWMMYRSGWARKDGQQCVLAITMTRAGFARLCGAATLASFDRDAYASREAWQGSLRERPNRIQWDPDKDVHLRPVERRAIQLGIAPAWVERWVDEMIVGIEDRTALARRVEALVRAGDEAGARALLPAEPVCEVTP